MLKATWQADNAVLELDQYTGIAAAKEGSPLRFFIPASFPALLMVDPQDRVRPELIGSKSLTATSSRR